MKNSRAASLAFESIAGLVAFRGVWAIFVHANVRLSLGPLRVLFGALELHYWHHARLVQTKHSYANLAPWIDILFGTYHCPIGEERWPLGLDYPYPTGYLAQLLEPLQPRRPAGVVQQASRRRASRSTRSAATSPSRTRPRSRSRPPRA